MIICNVLTTLKIFENTAVVVDKPRDIFKKDIEVLDDKGKSYQILSVGMERLNDYTDESNNTSLLLAGRFASGRLYLLESNEFWYMRELIQRLINISDVYDDFILGVINYAKKDQTHIELLNEYMSNEKELLSSDVIEFIANQPDFHSCSKNNVFNIISIYH